MNLTDRITLAVQAVNELGPRKLGQYAWYRLALDSGFFRWQTRKGQPPGSKRFQGKQVQIQPFLTIPCSEQLEKMAGREGLRDLLAEASEICSGQVRLFGGVPVALQLVPSRPLKHWSRYQSGESGGNDIKWIWEPARFGWAYTLGRAFVASGEERYAAAFWHYTEIFLAANPPNLGPNWASAQEVALRLMALSFGLQVFTASTETTPARVSTLIEAILQHARRIPPTLSYAWAQNNNHLLVEAAGLFTAGCLLPSAASAHRWRDLGWRTFNAGLLSQIDDEGAYVQQSTNYHRLMLHVALWMQKVASANGVELPEASKQALSRATLWLAELVDQNQGRVPNLGPNDAANILPLASRPFHDYRPTIQAASQAFVDQPVFQAGPWDEMQLWLGNGPSEDKGLIKQVSTGEEGNQQQTEDPSAARAAPQPCLPSKRVIRSDCKDTWAYLRAVHFHDRPGHADQLHVDLWWRGLNIAQDAGTFLYNQPPPWDNALAKAFVHNTVTVNRQDQMTRASRFLYLNWAQARVNSVERSQDGDCDRIKAFHNGFRRLGVIHWRSLSLEGTGTWVVEDRLVTQAPARQEKSYSIRLHWLLPDWEYRLVNSHLFLHSPYGWVELKVHAETDLSSPVSADVQLVRAGNVLFGDGEAYPAAGWVSPTYGIKIPALSYSLTVQSRLPLLMVSKWKFPPGAEE